MDSNPIKRLFAQQISINSAKHEQTSENLIPTYAVKAELLKRHTTSKRNPADTQNITFDYTIVSLDDTPLSESTETVHSDENGK